MALGSILLRVIERVDQPSAVEALREAGYYATVMNARGRDGDVQIIFSVIPRRRQNDVLRLVRGINPNAYVTFEQTSKASVAVTAASPLRMRK